MPLSIIILAAGKGKRMVSKLPKVLQPLGGIPLLTRVVNTAQQLKPEAIFVVYGNGSDEVRQRLNNLPVQWIEQAIPQGTGDAVLQALPFCAESQRVLVLYGDVPLISKQAITKLLTETPPEGIGFLVACVENPTGLGRVIRNQAGWIVDIIEQKDATLAQRAIQEINTGIMVAPAHLLKRWLPLLQNNNQQKEYYLTDIVKFATKDNIVVSGISIKNPNEIRGINDLWELSELERFYQIQKAKELILSGVKIIDPSRVDFRTEDIKIAPDVTIDVNVILEGKIEIGPKSYIGPHTVLKNVIVGESVEILANCVLEGVTIENHCAIGPFARLRPGTILKEAVKVGNFVEIKNSTLAQKTKANHLSYLGDALIGEGVNIGAGTITCNYDGANKWQTVIGNYAFIGSNVSLVAPINVGENATIGAGSTISRLAVPNKLTIARALARTVEGWSRPLKEK